MAVLAVKKVDVEGHPAMVDKGLEELLDEFEVKGADFGSLQFHVIDEAGPH